MEKDRVKIAITMQGDECCAGARRCDGNTEDVLLTQPHGESGMARFGSWGWRMTLGRKIKWITSTSGQDGVTETVVKTWIGGSDGQWSLREGKHTAFYESPSLPPVRRSKSRCLGAGEARLDFLTWVNADNGPGRPKQLEFARQSTRAKYLE